MSEKTFGRPTRFAERFCLQIPETNGMVTAILAVLLGEERTTPKIEELRFPPTAVSSGYRRRQSNH
jgi:hypothetical protein